MPIRNSWVCYCPTLSISITDELYDHTAAAVHAERDSIAASPKSPSGSMGEDDLSLSPQSGINIDQQGRKKEKKNTFGIVEQRIEQATIKVDPNAGRDKSVGNASPSQGENWRGLKDLKEYELQYPSDTCPLIS